MAEHAGKHMKGEDASSRTCWDFATAGTYADAQVPRGVWAVVLAVALVLVALPSVGMIWARTDSTTENRMLAEPPVLFDDDGAFNVNVLADAGAYFDDHFAYRNVLVTANARVRAALGTSATDQVVVGRDGWLYYGGTLPDYLGQNELSERSLRNIAHNLALAQSYAESQGAAFAFMLAPNKSSLYSAHMPYYYVKAPGEGNFERLKPLLDEAGVNYVDLFALFDGDAGERYLKRDSHWDNRGALMAAQELLSALGRDPLDLTVADAIARDDFAGDLESMLYPVGAQPEENWYFEGYDDGAGMSGARWAYDEGGDVTDSWIRTRSLAEGGGLLMFRYSFGNALAPLLAPAFKSAAFSKRVPYNLPDMGQVGADAVVIERAERHLSYLATNPPILPAPVVELEAGLPADEGDASGSTTLSVSEDGPYWKLEGVADGQLAGNGSRLLVGIEPVGADAVVYDASWKTVADGEGGTASDFGYQAYVGSDVVDLHGATVRVYAVDGDTAICLKTFRDVR